MKTPIQCWRTLDGASLKSMGTSMCIMAQPQHNKFQDKTGTMFECQISITLNKLFLVYSNGRGRAELHDGINEYMLNNNYS